ncbi:helix-turn-helix domain-containing protein [Treponema bryantii]|uniref:helix-turn-helix domain-containing protein n=1 Tax=Treponema bryantii TaxID=163 RepID=UPI0003B35AB5|nr:helix-turn-helix transcriptional regulator [Treponema bryantii]
MTNIRTVLAINMKARRKDLNLSQAILAEKIGTSPNYISKIEAEKQFPSVQMIEQLALALQCDSIDLFSIERIKINNLETVKESLCNDVISLIQEKFTTIKY